MNLISIYNPRCLAFIAFICIALCSTITFADLAVIVHKDKGITSISQTELGRIFLGKASTFSDGSTVIPINQVFSSSARGQFDKEILKRSESQMKSYWSKMMFSGEGTPPAEVNGDLDVLLRVMNDVNAIGYIDSSAVNEGVKVLEIK